MKWWLGREYWLLWDKETAVFCKVNKQEEVLLPRAVSVLPSESKQQLLFASEHLSQDCKRVAPFTQFHWFVTNLCVCVCVCVCVWTVISEGHRNSVHILAIATALCGPLTDRRTF